MHEDLGPDGSQYLPEETIDRWTSPVAKFLRIEAASGVLLGLAALIALVVANSSGNAAWQAFWNADLTIGSGSFVLSYPRWYWVNDALMAVFFFLVGLEIKRELVSGHLSKPSQVVLPVFAAIGGAVVPAGIFMAMQAGTEGARGWAIPMATDIAFVVGALAILGTRIPVTLKVLLLSLAIVDDLMAVVVIAVFFSKGISAAWLAGMAATLAFMLLLRLVGVRRVSVYVLFGVWLWLCTLKAGLHPTIAGVALGFMTPSRPWLKKDALRKLIYEADSTLARSMGTGKIPSQALENLAFGAKEAMSPLYRLEHYLHPWVGFVIMPIFALANAGVPFSAEGLESPLSLAISAALVLGKPVGICLFAWFAVRFVGSKLPEGVSWPAMVGAGALCGTGFTMSLFITSLSFEGGLVDAARMGVLIGSGISLFAGMAILFFTLKPKSAGESQSVAAGS